MNITIDSTSSSEINISSAKKLTDHGFSIIPLKDKFPIRKYADRREQLATNDEIESWFSNGNGKIAKANGIAIAINSTEFGIDIDGDKCESLFLNKIIPNLLAGLQDKIDKTMHTKSPRGHHRTFRILSADFPKGISERTIVKFEGHNEIAIKGIDHIFNERGPGYEVINDVDCVVTLSKKEAMQILDILDDFKAKTSSIKTVLDVLKPHYKEPSRHKIALCLAGYLHKGGVPKHLIYETIESLVSETNDSEIADRLKAVEDTCSKDRNSIEVSGARALLEALDNDKEAIVEIGTVFHVPVHVRGDDGNGRDKEGLAEIDPAVDLDPYITDKDYAEYLIDTAKKTVKREDSLIRQITYVAISKDSDNPLNLAVLATTGEGKTHAVVETLKPFDRLGLWVIGSMSPKVIIRQNGILVNSNNEPIEDTILDLKRQIKECKRNGQNEEAEALEQHLRQLYDDAKILIDLSGKLFLFLERPHEDTWNIFKTTLSHDKWEIEHPYVYEVQGMGFKVKKVVLRGWPACIYCSAQNESRSELWPEIQSRFLVTSPNMIPEKYQEGNMLIAQQMSLPRSILKKIIRSDKEAELAAKCAMYLSQNIKKLSPQDPSANVQPVFIPYGGVLGAILKGDKGTDNRINKRVFSFLRMIALSRTHLRYKLHYGQEKLVIADFEDFHEVLHITQNFTGIPPDKLKEYRDVFLAAYRSKIRPDVNKDGSKQEDIIAVTTNDCCKKHKEVTGIGINAKAYRPRYIDEWINASLIEEQKSNIDNKQYIYFPLADLSDDDIEVASQTQKTESKSKNKCMSFLISSISVLSHLDNISQHSKIIVQKNSEGIPAKWLELCILGLLRYPDANDTFEIIDKNNQKVCIFRFIKDYLGPNRSLSGYVSNTVFYNNDKEISDEIKNLEDFDSKRCKTLSLSCDLDNKDITSPPNGGNGIGNGNGDSSQPQFRYSCYYCDDFYTNNQDYYENHMARKHYRLPAYPSVADLQRHGLKAQSKSWGEMNISVATTE